MERRGGEKGERKGWYRKRMEKGVLPTHFQGASTAYDCPMGGRFTMRDGKERRKRRRKGRKKGIG